VLFAMPKEIAHQQDTGSADFQERERIDDD
jgi:hypothetical protein